ncbi:c-type cytochrome domain-containing protein [Algoriphagus marinus]|uniref:c-type cytochrome domain-containing protein n=1 Tax=Algoriphagus marinus TaxID=1925762 RepID=UPI00094BA3E4|nr:c-type cytochrome domain-containing protein [Algoriphagus marinus]
MNLLLQADSTLFLGRFHSLAVHLPIGFLVLAAILYVFSRITRNESLLKPIPIILFFGALGAIASVVLGWFLSEEGGYPEDTIFWHQWLGIAVAVFSTGSWLWIKGVFKKKEPRASTTTRRSEDNLMMNKGSLGLVLAVLVLLISITGHLGGNLTHGEDYLFVYAPEALQSLFLDEETGKKAGFEFPVEPDSVLLFGHVIEKVLNQKCGSCHNEETKKGGFLVTSQEGLLEGGENGAVLQSGSPMSSELFKRISMNPSSRKFMPTKGAAMSYSETILLKFWIEEGMPFDMKVTDERIPEELKLILQSEFELVTERKPIYEKEQVDPLIPELLRELQENGFRVRTLSEENNFLEVVATDSMSSEKINSLLKVKGQITWLDLSNSGIKDEWLSPLSQFEKLTRLNLNSNPLSDLALSNIKELPYLESILLHSTQVSDEGVKQLSSLKNLQRIYVWNTEVTEEIVDSIQRENSKLKIDLGVKENTKVAKTSKVD